MTGKKEFQIFLTVHITLTKIMMYWKSSYSFTTRTKLLNNRRVSNWTKTKVQPNMHIPPPEFSVFNTKNSIIDQGSRACC